MTAYHIIGFIMGLSCGLGVFATAFIASARRIDSQTGASDNISASVIWSD